MRSLNQNKTFVIVSKSRTLSNRNNVAKLISEITKLNVSEVIVDFKNIEIMSRSFAQEYQKQKDELPFVVRDINLNSFLEKMLVISTQRRNTAKVDFSKWLIEKLPAD